MVITYCCWRIIFLLGSQAWEWYHFIHGTHFGSILTTEGWAVLDYVGSDPILHFGRGISVQGADAQALFDSSTASQFKEQILKKMNMLH